MKIRAQIVHETPGRVRVQLPEQRGDRDFFAHLSEQLEQSRLFQGVRVNPVTGSIVLEFTGSRDEVLEKLRAQLPFELELSVPPEATVPAQARALPGNPFRLVSGRDVNPMLMASALFAAVGVAQAFRGKIMVPSLSAFWYAVSAFRLARKSTPGDPAGST